MNYSHGVLVAVFLFATSIPPRPAMAPAMSEITHFEQIPNGYKSWSLFLICNPEWTLNKGDEGIKSLYKAFDAYGRAIGRANLAVWFWRRQDYLPTVKAIDIERMSEYCEKFGLTPSETPQVVTTTKYPDDVDVGERIVAKLNGDEQSSAHILAILTDQLLKTGLSQEDLTSKDGWGRFISAVISAMGAVGCYFNKVSFSVNTGAFNAEIAHSSETTCNQNVK